VTIWWPRVAAATKYRVWRTDSADAGAAVGTPLAEPTEQTYVDTAVATGSTWYYRVAAVMPDRTSTPSAPSAPAPIP
jgi:fibronectin type 3 domain-containing protein